MNFRSCFTNGLAITAACHRFDAQAKSYRKVVARSSAASSSMQLTVDKMQLFARPAHKWHKKNSEMQRLRGQGLYCQASKHFKPNIRI